MGKSTTAFERFRERHRESKLATEGRIFNPLSLKIGDMISLNIPECQELDFQVLEISEVRRKVGGEDYPLADYRLIHRGLSDDDEKSLVLRVIPLADPDLDAGERFTLIALHAQESMEYSEDVHAVLKADEGFSLYPGTEQEEVFPARVSDVTEPYDVVGVTIKDLNHDGKIDDSEAKRWEAQYWDFWRNVAPEGEDEKVEYLIVEMDTKDGWMEIWMGPELSPHAVEIL